MILTSIILSIHVAHRCGAAARLVKIRYPHVPEGRTENSPPLLLFSNAQRKGGRGDLKLFFKGHGEMGGGGESGFAGDAFYRAGGVFDDEAFGVFKTKTEYVLMRGLSAVMEKKTGEMAKGHASQGLQLSRAQLVGEVVLNEGLHALEDHTASELQVLVGVHSLRKVADGIEHARDEGGEQGGGVCLRKTEIPPRCGDIDQLPA